MPTSLRSSESPLILTDDQLCPILLSCVQEGKEGGREEGREGEGGRSEEGGGLGVASHKSINFNH